MAVWHKYTPHPLWR